MHRNNALIFAAIVPFLLASGTVHAQMPGEGKSVQPIRPAGIQGNIFPHDVIAIGLERLGYKVKPALEADYPPLHLAVAQGDADYMATEWIPTHEAFFLQAGGDDVMERVGTYITGAGQGYFIDKATADAHDITNLGQLADPEIAKLFDSDGDGKANLTGCNPGWGCERVIEHQLDAFELRDTVHHDQGSYFALIADMITRYEAGQPVLFYTWTPQWIGAVMRPGHEVTQIDVPHSASPDGNDTEQADGSNPGFEVNTIAFLGNKEFLAENPAARRLFELVQIPIADVNAVILRQHRGENSEEQIMEQAREWVAANEEQFAAWVDEAAKAE